MLTVIPLSVLCSLFIFVTSLDPIRVVRTAKDTSDRLTRKPPISWNPIQSISLDDLWVKIDPSTTFQEMEGFGGAITESAAIVISQMRPDLQDEILGAYYGPTGNGYTLSRLHINSCDFSLGNWSCDPTPNDFQLLDFSLTDHDVHTIIPVVQRAVSLQPDLKLFASAWSPPAWFKKNGAMDGTATPDGLKDPTASLPYEKTWARFYSRWIDAYESHGLKIFAVTTQNEPTNVPRLNWEACAFSPSSLRNFSRVLTTELSLSHPDVEVIVHDDQKDTLLRYVPVILSDELVLSLASYIGFHWYAGPYFENLDLIHSKYPSMKLLPTEATYTHFVAKEEDIRWERGEGYAKDILGDLNHWAVGWVDWNIVLDQNGGPNHVGNQCDAPIIANVINQTLTYQMTYFYMGQFSRFIRPGSVRIGNVQSKEFVKSSNEIQVTSWKRPDGVIVLVLMNLSPDGIVINVVDGQEAAKVEMLPRSIQTLMW